MNKCPFYFPLENGRYEVKPGLYPLGTDFGNGQLEHRTFQIDTNYDKYIREKRQALNNKIENYYCTFNPSLSTLVRICSYIAYQLNKEYPTFYSLETNSDQITLLCRPIGKLKPKKIVIPINYSATNLNLLLSVMNQLLLIIQEDIAIVELTDEADDFISLLHLCFPNYWSATEKIGKSFIDAHKPVPEMQSIQKRSKQLISALIEKGPFVRFAWGLSTDDRLDHHFESDTKSFQNSETDKLFNSRDPKLYLRVERQVITGFSDVNSFMFTIRTYIYNVAELKRNVKKRDALISALGTMSEATLKYKGLFNSKDLILEWLNDK